MSKSVWETELPCHPEPAGAFPPRGCGPQTSRPRRLGPHPRLSNCECVVDPYRGGQGRAGLVARMGTVWASGVQAKPHVCCRASCGAQGPPRPLQIGNLGSDKMKVL